MKKKQPNTDRTSMWSAAAKAEGMSYGQWVAKHYPPGTSPEDSTHWKICPFCGKRFTTNYSNKIYCTPDCTYYARERRRREARRHREEKEKPCSTTL